MSEEYIINEDWEEYYKFLEALRRTGVCNMYGASVYLEECYNLSTKEARSILANWMDNYNELSDKYDWKNTNFNQLAD